jgi:redox-sensitive bicupin YhaK (pirin superfamily)
MYHIIPSHSRGQTQIGWLDSRHSFSFGQYYDPERMGFGPLRVINDDFIGGGAGFPTHPHADMEIMTIVLKGAIAHRDSLGNGSTIRPGDVQMMRAGSGIRHSEFNPSQTDACHLLQIWLLPREADAEPAYQQRSFGVLNPDVPAPEGWQPLATPDGGGAAGPLHILQDARISAARLPAGGKVGLTARADRRYWLQVMAGGIEVVIGEERLALQQGDALALENESRSADIVKAETADGEAQVLLFDMGR